MAKSIDKPIKDNLYKGIAPVQIYRGKLNNCWKVVYITPLEVLMINLDTKKEFKCSPEDLYQKILSKDMQLIESTKSLWEMNKESVYKEYKLRGLI